MTSKLRKINALQRQFDIVIILNNNPQVADRLYTLEGKLHKSSDNENARSRNSKYKSPQIKLSQSEWVREQFTGLNEDNKFIIQNNKNEYIDKTIFTQLLDYNKKTQFCGLLNHFIEGEMYFCDFVIILNDTLFDNHSDYKTYHPLCMAIVKLVPNKETGINNLYIDGICANEETYNCGSYLMNLLKYISAKAFNCSEIRVDSIQEAKKFYNTKKFIRRPNETDEEGYLVRDYNLYYKITENEEYIPPPTIQGTPQLISVKNLRRRTKKSNKKQLLGTKSLSLSFSSKKNKDKDRTRKAKSI